MPWGGVGVAMWMVWGDVVYARAGDGRSSFTPCVASRLVMVSALKFPAAFLRVMMV